MAGHWHAFMRSADVPRVVRAACQPVQYNWRMAVNLEQWRLRQKVEGKPMTCEQAARALGVQEDVFYRWRTGERFPSVRSWVGIFSGFGVRLGDVRQMRRIARAQLILWRAHPEAHARAIGACSLCITRVSAFPPGWGRLMAMIGGAK